MMGQTKINLLINFCYNSAYEKRVFIFLKLLIYNKKLCLQKT
jgi:hypothetical protein